MTILGVRDAELQLIEIGNPIIIELLPDLFLDDFR